MAKEEEVPPLNIDRALAAKPRNRVALVGVEIEGAWRTVPNGAKFENDGSVFRGRIPDGFTTGEIPLGPMQPTYLAKAVKKYFPDKVDATCGMHVHMSFETLYQYNLLADSPAYQETVVEYMGRWAKEHGLKSDHPLWPRLRGESVYCQKRFWPHEQMLTGRKDHDQKRHGHRYTIIHYCWGRYRTVECRLLPMMETADLSISAIRHLIDITNAYLMTADKKKVKDSGKVLLDSGDIYEEYTETRL